MLDRIRALEEENDQLKRGLSSLISSSRTQSELDIKVREEMVNKQVLELKEMQKKDESQYIKKVKSQANKFRSNIFMKKRS